jgi:hypothetical protein
MVDEEGDLVLSWESSEAVPLAKGTCLNLFRLTEEEVELEIKNVKL